MSCSSRVSRTFKGISDDSRKKGEGTGYVHKKRRPPARVELHDVNWYDCVFYVRAELVEFHMYGGVPILEAESTIVSHPIHNL